VCAPYFSGEEWRKIPAVHRDQNRETKRGRKAASRGDKKMWFSPYGLYIRELNTLNARIKEKIFARPRRQSVSQGAAEITTRDRKSLASAAEAEE
jgi:hypothetical protein